ncbi:hypothetical protein C8R45DRAFT_1104419 [Mycena sanguinolenta]|nr:hypothetical protein C8R45DRAFT_1104419 [Mycena sanguinolenta]
MVFCDHRSNRENYRNTDASYIISYLRYKPYPDPDRDALLAACAPTLQILEIEYRHPFVLPTLPSLWHLELLTHEDRIHIPGAIPAGVSLAIQATPRLEELTVAIRESDKYHLFDWGILARTHAPEWAALDDRLSEMHTQERGQDSSGNKHPKLLDAHFSLRYFGTSLNDTKLSRFAVRPDRSISSLPHPGPAKPTGFESTLSPNEDVHLFSSLLPFLTDSPLLQQTKVQTWYKLFRLPVRVPVL